MVTVYISHTVRLGQVWPRRPAISAHIDIGHTASIYSGPMHGISIDSYILCLPFLAYGRALLTQNYSSLPFQTLQLVSIVPKHCKSNREMPTHHAR